MEVIEVDVVALSFLVGTVIPILVGLVTKARASSGVKATANALLSAIAGATVVAIQSNGKIDVWSVILGIGMTWVSSVGTYYGLLKPTGASAKVQDATATVGVG